MLIFYKNSELKQKITELKQQGKTIGFVPTMGALHAGHISLVNISKQNCDITVCSIFVNPTQFNNATDLKLYPRTPDADIKLLEEGGCDILFMPEVDDIYPEKDTRQFNFGFLDTVLEGATRPGHYNGVGQVVSILFDCVKPHKAYFGSKDYQQVMVVKDLVKQMQSDIEIIPCPIMREEDGLAMSSRNTRLSEQERVIAALVPKIMQQANTIIKTKGIAEAKLFVLEITAKVSIMKLDYFEVCNADTLEILNETKANEKAVSLIAVFVGNIRLIDNWIV